MQKIHCGGAKTRQTFLHTGNAKQTRSFYNASWHLMHLTRQRKNSNKNRKRITSQSKLSCPVRRIHRVFYYIRASV